MCDRTNLKAQNAQLDTAQEKEQTIIKKEDGESFRQMFYWSSQSDRNGYGLARWNFQFGT
jgi:hypothetical protein